MPWCLKQRLAASSIVESMTAMLIILISFGAGMSIYLNIMTNEKLLSKTKANALLTQVLEKSIQEQNHIDERIQMDELLIEKKVKPYPHSPQHHQYVLKAFDPKQQLIYEVKEIIYVPEVQ